MGASNPLFILPKSLTGRRPAMDVKGHVQSLYQENKLPLAKSLETHQDYLDSLSGDVNALIGVLQQTNIITPPVPPSIPSPEEFVLTVALTTITPGNTPVEGIPLSVFITQDATGGRQILWGTNVKWATVEIITAAHTVSLFTFVGRADPVDGIVKWYCTGVTPVTGQTP